MTAGAMWGPHSEGPPRPSHQVVGSKEPSKDAEPQSVIRSILGTKLAGAGQGEMLGN